MTSKHSLKKISIISVLLFVLLEVISYSYTAYMQELAEKDILMQSDKEFKEYFNFANNYLTDVSKIFYQIKVQNDQETANILYKANRTTDKNIHAKLRQQLYNKYITTYNLMKEHDVRQFHFHLLDGTSFLRFHMPEKFGDPLFGIRPALVYVNKTKEPVHCFEEGRIFNGFRNVYPLFKDKTFVGTVEISYSFDALQDRISHVDGSYSFLLMKTDVIKKKVFAREQANYEKSEFSGFVYDKSTLEASKLMTLKQLMVANERISFKVKEKLQQAELFSIEFRDKKTHDNSYIIVNFIPLYNLEHENVAYIVNYRISSLLNLLKGKAILFFILLSVAAGLVSVIIFLVLFLQSKRVKKIYELATRDPLTSIYNRKGLFDILKRKVGEVHRYERALSVIFFDIDHFKQVNDAYGHDTGDKVLIELSKLVSKGIRQSDIFVRWGGEEFLIVLPETPKKRAVRLAEKLRTTIENHLFGKIKNITCSFGVTALQKDDSLQSLLKRVDMLLYKAKNSGRNIVIDA